MEGNSTGWKPPRVLHGGDGRSGENRAGARVLPWPKGTKEGRYGDAFDRAMDGVMRRNTIIGQERSSAAKRTRRLLEQPPGRRSLLLGNHPDFGGWWLAALLADEADGHRRDDPATAVQLARLATEVANRIDEAAGPAGPATPPEPAGEPLPGHPLQQSPEQPLVEDVTARSWRSLADAQRRTGDLEAAAASLARARRHLRRGTREPLERAALLESSARLLAARGRRRATACFAAASSLYDDLGEEHRAGRCRLALLLLEDAPAGAAERRLQALELRQGLGMLEAGREPELVTAARRRLASLSGRGGGEDAGGEGEAGGGATGNGAGTGAGSSSATTPACGSVVG